MVGEKVIVDKTKVVNPKNMDECALYHDRIGFVEEINTQGITISFYRGTKSAPSKELAGEKAFFEGKSSGKSTGLFRYSFKREPQERQSMEVVQLEVVYLKKGDTFDFSSKVRVLDYLQPTENKSNLFYFTGMVTDFAIGRDGDMYFKLKTAQHPNEITISPAKGQLLYLGLRGHRPSGWLEEAISMRIIERKDF